ncbi:MAG: hypothetical protein ACTSUX_15370 [Promethearchaeota archaeon]
MEVPKNLIKILDSSDFIFISGESGLGKTLLALHFCINWISSENDSRNQCIWVQASENFPKKRLIQVLKGNSANMEIVLQNLYIIPRKGIFFNYNEQSKFFRNFPKMIISPDIGMLVIDNISHHLRTRLFQASNPLQKLKIQDDFYRNQLLNVFSKCFRENIKLILIHEMTFDIQKDKPSLFFSKLFDRIDALNIILLKDLKNNCNKIVLNHENRIEQFNYFITNYGIKFA